MEINKQAGKSFVEKIAHHFNGDLKNKTIAILGLSFKPNTDDMREAPSIHIIESLLKEGATVVAYDPVAMENAKSVLPDKVRYAKNAYETAKGADAVAVLTEWNEFRKLDLAKFGKSLNELVLFDGRNIYDPTRVKQLGFMYYGVGRM
jgi:UDPglucose 6-dehydrogenase